MGKQNKIYLILFALGVFALPFFLRNNYHLMVLNISALNILVVIGLNLLVGLAGQISLGHAAFFGLGAYLSGILTTAYAIGPWCAMTISAVAVGGLAFLIGFPILKLKGHYLAMATLGFGIIVYILFNETVELTGGPSGLSGIPNLSIGPLTFDSDEKNYYLIWGFTLLTMLLSINLSH